MNTDLKFTLSELDLDLDLRPKLDKNYNKIKLGLYHLISP